MQDTLRMPLKWIVVGVAAFFVAVAVIFWLGTRDCELSAEVARSVRKPDLSLPKDEENIYVGMLAAQKVYCDESCLECDEDDDEEEDDEDELTPEQEKARMDAFLATNAAAIAILHEAAKRPFWRDKDFVAFCERELAAAVAGSGADDEELRAIDLLRLLDEDGRRRLERGEIASAMEDMRSLLSIGMKMQDGVESSFNWLLAGVSCRLALQLAREAARSKELSDGELETIRELIRPMCDSDRLRRSVMAAVDAEHWLRDRLFGRPGSLSDSMPHGPLGWILQSFAFHPNRVRNLLAEDMREARELLSRDFDKAACAAFDAKANAVLHKGRLAILRPNYVGEVLVKLSVQGVYPLASSRAQLEFEASATSIVLSLEMCRRKTGRRVEKLADLVPQFLPSVPVDPYDTAVEIKYDAKSGILWSVGEDRIFTGKELPDPNDFRARDTVIKIDGE